MLLSLDLGRIRRLNLIRERFSDSVGQLNQRTRPGVER